MPSFTTASTDAGVILSAVALLLFLNTAVPTTASRLSRTSKCSACSDADRARCPVVTPSTDCEVIDEPNCGCCQMCAKKLGEKCGVATGLCESGLECIPPPLTQEQYDQYGEADYFLEVLLGDFICVTQKQFLDILTGVAYEDDSANGETPFAPELYDPKTGLVIEEVTDDEILQSSYESSNENPTEDMSHLNPFIPSIESVSSSTRPVEPPAAPFQGAAKPCKYHEDKVWGKKYFDHHEWIPSCEKDGFYFPEQCELSFGLERGRCWCVGRSGNPVSKYIPGEQARPELCFSQTNKT